MSDGIIEDQKGGGAHLKDTESSLHDAFELLSSYFNDAEDNFADRILQRKAKDVTPQILDIGQGKNQSFNEVRLCKVTSDCIENPNSICFHYQQDLDICITTNRSETPADYRIISPLSFMILSNWEKEAKTTCQHGCQASLNIGENMMTKIRQCLSE